MLDVRRSAEQNAPFQMLRRVQGSGLLETVRSFRTPAQNAHLERLQRLPGYGLLETGQSLLGPHVLVIKRGTEDEGQTIYFYQGW